MPTLRREAFTAPQLTVLRLLQAAGAGYPETEGAGSGSHRLHPTALSRAD